MPFSINEKKKQVSPSFTKQHGLSWSLYIWHWSTQCPKILTAYQVLKVRLKWYKIDSNDKWFNCWNCRKGAGLTFSALYFSCKFFSDWPFHSWFNCIVIVLVKAFYSCKFFTSFFFFFADLRPLKPPALAVLVYFFFQCVICIHKVS